ncbi:Predicted arabinose efflux permease, MFS family [Marinobacter persicus]|uniref:Predicted arabinose efflux permease, MFS family n=1 Tax=Marinobacter persicus TaxID=930118 RepID=A0A1I3V7I7_9GAMM|nr:YbfB/YjiJ family MFS transporter [Marinobacter persicus]GHD41581.1 MFS transporter [Marinobacter persicus]SFJ90913.1 Predicted arabinose efflux permease, MFS family [Marinobacter persicus]
MTSQTAANPRQLFTVLLAGACVLLVVHALGRFIYTPLLPYLVDDGQFSASDGAAVATWNYLGYLMGAMVAIKWHRIAHIRVMLPLFLAVHVITTLIVTQTDNLTLISASRWLNGVANGVVFVQAPALILEWLVLRNRATMSGLVYIGVGAGLLVSSGLVTGTAGWLEGAERWWPAALLSIPLAWWGVVQLRKLDIPVRQHDDSGKELVNTPLIDRASAPLFLSYAGAGLGYILPMTFLPLLAKLELPEGHALLDGTWVIVALFTIPAPWIWNKLGARMGDLPALRLNFLIQLLGVLAAVLWPGALGLMLCAALVGGTFLGTVLLTQRLGRALHPHQGPRLSAAMVALYGFTQMVGPWLTKQWLDGGGTLVSAFGIGVAALAFGLLLAFFVPKPEDWHARSQ